MDGGWRASFAAGTANPLSPHNAITEFEALKKLGYVPMAGSHSLMKFPAFVVLEVL